METDLQHKDAAVPSEVSGDIGFVGGGVMAESIVAGLLARNVMKPSQIRISYPRSERRAALESRFGIAALEKNDAVVWRGPMIHKLLTQFLEDGDWGELDYLVIDLPPGTGDAQLTVAQQVPLAGGVIVTTPQDVALLDVKRGITMFQQVNAPVLGVVENMSYHLCPGCGARADIFSHGGGERMAREYGVPFLGEIPLLSEIRAAGDRGIPIVAANPDHPQSRAFIEVAGAIDTQLTERAAGMRVP